MPTFNGTSADDTLSGSSGDDVINGLAGADIMRGGLGNDRYYVDNVSDRAIENVGEGTDTVYSSIDHHLRDNIENLTLIGSAVRGTGNALANRLVGNGADNILNGLAGADIMRGGLGNDGYYVDNAGDLAIENAGEGTDTVYSSVTYRLRENVENLTLTGSAERALGNSGSNRLIGNAGNNLLDGGAGADDMRGGLGNDSYYVDNAGDLAIENAGEGTDTVYSSVTYRLRENVENLTLTGSAERALGNSGSNRLIGNAGNNLLDGGAGADEMRGGLGDDRYLIDNIEDRAIEKADAGTDTVYSSINFTLGSNLENLTLMGSAEQALGNSGSNRLVGNGADNILNGLAGADIMRGGLGNDSYYVDNAGDLAIENAGEGTDTVYSSINFTLGSNLENLTLTGTAAINGTGNSLDNFLTGNSSINVLTGGGGNDVLSGGTGTDTLEGGAGNDIYYVDGTPDAAAPDVFFTDTVIEAAGGGSDTVWSMVAYYTLPENVEIGRIANNAFDCRLDGNDASNTLTSAFGWDQLFGHGGNDIIDGGPGNDNIYGGAGADNLTGGANNDIFFYSSVSDSPPTDADVIFDYRGFDGSDRDHDVIDLSAIDANANVDGDQAFSLVGAPTNAAGQLWISSEPGNQYNIFGDVDGDGLADFQLHVVMTNLGTVPLDIVY